MSDIITTTSDLPTLRKNIREENAKALSTAKKSLEHVRKCGDLLVELKANVKHGAFQHELKKLEIEQRTANNYMRISSNWKRVSDLNLCVRDAIAMLSIPTATGLTTISDGIKVITIGKKRTEDAEQPPAPSRPAASEVIDAELIEPENAEPEPLVVDGTKDKASPKTRSDAPRLTNDETLDDYLMSELARISPEWAKMDKAFIEKRRAEARAGDQTDTIKNLIYELWILAPAVRTQILTGIINHQSIKP